MTVRVIKVGGAFLDNPDIAGAFFETLHLTKSQLKTVIVHGGGNAVERLFNELGLPSEKIDGLRVTPKSQIDYVVGALAGTVNKKLCVQAKQAGVKTIGLTLFDGDMTLAHKISAELGNVGNADCVDCSLLSTLLAEGFTPIISSIGADDRGELLNVNADQAAVVIAKLLNAELFLLSDVAGVLDEQKNLIPKLDAQSIVKLVEDGVIKDGMTVKVNAALDAANAIGQSVTIASWKDTQLFADNQALGTTIVPESQAVKRA